MTDSQSLLRVTDLKKYFGGVKALDGVNFTVAPGEIHALVGENGAGKSTLIKVLTGVHSFDYGSIELLGAPYRPNSPKDAKQAGVQVVHQEFNLLDHLSIAENISIEEMPRNRLGLLNHRQMNHNAKQALAAVGLDVDVRTPISALGIAHQQLVEIARALQSESRLLILDEPTATLTERETSRLFEIIRRIRDDGVTVMFVSHHLNEVFDLCDRVTIFRNGKTVTTEVIAETSPQQVVRHMVGRNVEQIDDHNPRTPGEVALSVQNLRTQASPHVDGVSFDLRYGEILGIAGLVGAGRTEILRALFGLDPKQGGTITIDGKPANIATPGAAVQAGLGLVTENRKQEGLILSMPIAVNASLVNLKKLARRGMINFSNERTKAKEAGEKLALKYGKVEDPVSSLSGGNQQKVVLAKWLANDPRVLMLDEPTRGVDVGAKFEIYEILRDLAAQGKAILIVSSELPELMALCDRLVVLANHKISGTLPREDFEEERILQLAYGHSHTEEPA